MRLTFWLISILFVLGQSVEVLAAPPGANKTICCLCQDAAHVTFEVEQPAGFQAADICPTACAASRGTWQKSARPGSCRPPNITQNIAPLLEWCITHQGVQLFNGETRQSVATMKK